MVEPQQNVDQGVNQNAGPLDLGETATSAATGDSALSNETTGSNSANQNTQNTTNEVDLTQTNDATVNNGMNLDANSGSNTVSENTRGGSVSTGDIQGSIDILNVTNSVFAPGSSIGSQSLMGGSQDLYLLASDGRTFLPTNDLTGANSINENTVNGTNVIHMITNNTADIDNDVTILADTGSNIIEDNTSLGDFMTGSIDLALNLINLVNLQLPNLLLTLDVWSIFGDVNGNLVLPTNSNTGSNSLNTNTVNQTNTTTLGVTQTADISNAFDIGTNTGNNTLRDNSVVGNVETGDVNVTGGVTNIANAGRPMLYLINVMGQWFGQAVLPGVGVLVNELGNSNTGSNSINENTVNETNTIDTELNQTADVDNTITMDLNTGNNTLNRNTKVGNVTTGSIDVMANVVNFVNSFGSDLSEFSLGIVNIFGNWFGNAGAPTASSTATASSLGTDSGSQQPVAPSSQSASPTVAPQSTASVAAATTSTATDVTPSASTGAGSATTSATTTTENHGSNAAVVTASTTTTIASAQVLGATETLDAAAQVAGSAATRQSSSLPWIVAGVALLLCWIVVEIMAARTARDEAANR